MTLTQLSTFIAIIENGSFTAAANQLGMHSQQSRHR